MADDYKKLVANRQMAQHPLVSGWPEAYPQVRINQGFQAAQPQEPTLSIQDQWALQNMLQALGQGMK